MHCPNCGYATVYALKTKSKTIRGDNNEPLRVMAYSCRGCGTEFTDIDRQNCHAPAQAQSKTEARAMAVAKKATPEVQNTLLEGLYKKRPELRERVKQNAVANADENNPVETHTNTFEREIEEKINDAGGAVSGKGASKVSEP